VPPTEPPTLPTAALALAVTAAIALATTAAPLATAAAAQPAAAIIPPALAATAAAAIALAAAAVAQPTAATTQPAVAATAITAVALANAAGSQPATPIVAIAAPTTTAVALPAAAIALTVLTSTVAAACRLQELQPALSLRSLRWNYRLAAHHTHTPRFGLGATLTLTLSSRTIHPILLEVSAAPSHTRPNPPCPQEGRANASSARSQLDGGPRHCGASSSGSLGAERYQDWHAQHGCDHALQRCHSKRAARTSWDRRQRARRKPAQKACAFNMQFHNQQMGSSRLALTWTCMTMRYNPNGPP
jgi:hypothetical protein